MTNAITSRIKCLPQVTAVRGGSATALWFVLLYLSGFAGSAPATDPALETIVARMTAAHAANQKGLLPYTVVREYRMFGKNGQDAKSHVVAHVRFTPPAEKEYEITKASGKGLGAKVVRKMLAGEADIEDKDSGDISPENYQFALLGEESLNGRHCYVLQLTPLRKDTHLLDGRAWVDSETYLIHRAEGEPAKKPSWWLKNVHFALTYEDVEGMWLATGIEATADIRILGHCRMISEDVDYRIGDMADTEPSRARPRAPVRRLSNAWR